MDIEYRVFEVQGAGQIRITTDSKVRCGTAKGISFDCSWSRFGMSGGVMDISEVKKLSDTLVLILNERKSRKKGTK
jgi:hypothetical protein